MIPGGARRGAFHHTLLWLLLRNDNHPRHFPVTEAAKHVAMEREAADCALKRKGHGARRALGSHRDWNN